MSFGTLSRKRILSAIVGAAGALVLTGTAFACIPMAGEFTVEANNTSLTVAGANEGGMGWCAPYDDGEFATSEIPRAAPGDTVSLTVRKTKDCAREGEQWNTLGGGPAELFSVDLRNGPAFVDYDADGVQEFDVGTGCYADADEEEYGEVHHLGEFMVNRGGNGKTQVTLPEDLGANQPTDSSVICINDTNTYDDTYRGGMLAPLQILAL